MDRLVNAISKLIVEGEIKKARQLAFAELNSCRQGEKDARLWSLYGSAVKLDISGDSSDLSVAREKMHLCENFTEQMEVDWLIDDMLVAIRRYDPSEAERILQRLTSKIHATDNNHIAAVFMVKGRIAYLHKDFDQSVQLHNKAEIQWKMRPKTASTRWQMDNNFYHLKALAALGKDKRSYRRMLAKDVISDGNNHTRHLRAQLINTGSFGNTVDELLTRCFNFV